MGALLGVVLKEGDKNLEVVIVIMFALTLFGFLTFFKVLYQRKMTTESRQRLNGIRGRLLEMAGGGDDNLKKILYSTDPSTAKYLGGDPTVLGLLALITALSGGIFTTTFIISYDAIAQRVPVCAVITGVLVAVLIFCGIWWYRRFKLSKWDQEGP